MLEALAAVGLQAFAAGAFAWAIVGLLFDAPRSLTPSRKASTMFKIVPNPTFTSKVALTVPGTDQPADLAVTWRHKGRAALSAWLAKPAAAAAAAAAPGAAGNTLLAGVPADAAWLAEVMADWSGPVLADGEPAQFCDAALIALLDSYPAAGGELMAAYLRASTESRAKN